jgi:hypothetical protein
MNEFYSVLVKHSYLVALSHKEKLFRSKLQAISYLEGGRIDWLMPAKKEQKTLSKLSVGLL